MCHAKRIPITRQPFSAKQRSKERKTGRLLGSFLKDISGISSLDLQDVVGVVLKNKIKQTAIRGMVNVSWSALLGGW